MAKQPQKKRKSKDGKTHKTAKRQTPVPPKPKAIPEHPVMLEVTPVSPAEAPVSPEAPPVIQEAKPVMREAQPAVSEPQPVTPEAPPADLGLPPGALPLPVVETPRPTPPPPPHPRPRVDPAEPIPFWRVLEEEYVRLGGVLPDEYCQARDAVVADRPADPPGTCPSVAAQRAEAWQKRENERILPGLYRLFHTVPTRTETEADANANLNLSPKQERNRETLSLLRTGICLSGGGVRSASFNLGILQGLARLNVLDKFDYLSTVSGGGYVGSWLSAWLRRDPHHMAGVTGELRGNRSARDQQVPHEPAHERPRVSPEAAPVSHLRSYASYLTPKYGIFSVDTWTLIAIYFRNLMLNWLVIVPLVLAALLLPRLMMSLANRTHGSTLPASAEPWAGRVADSLSAWGDGGAAAGGAMLDALLAQQPPMRWGVGFWAFVAAWLLGAWGFAYIGNNLPQRRLWSAGGRTSGPGQGPFLRSCLLPIVLSCLLVSTGTAWYQYPYQAVPDARLDGLAAWRGFAIFTAILPVVAWVMYAAWTRSLRNWRELLVSVAAGVVTGPCVCLALLALQQLRPGNDPALPLDAEAWGRFFAIYATLMPPLVLLAFSIGGTVYVGGISRLRWSDDCDREWWARFAGWVLIVAVVWLVASALVLLAPAYVLELWKSRGGAAATSVTAVVSGLLSIALGKSETTAGSAQSKAGGWPGHARAVVLALAAPVFVASLVVLASLFTSYLFQLVRGGPLGGDFHCETLFRSGPGFLLLATLAFLLVGAVTATLIDINRFSLHAVYRDRLVRAFLGASNNERTPDAFTGFDSADNFPIYQLRPEMLHVSDLIAGPGEQPGDRLIARLRKSGESSSDPAARHLLDKLTPELQQELFAAHPPHYTARLKYRLTQQLNWVLANDDFTRNGSPFPQDALPAADRRWLDQHPILRNRLLLAAAFEDEVRGDRDSLARAARPLHVVNVALNLVGGPELAWQQRKAASFTISPTHCGSRTLGYRDARTYGGPRGVSLGTAMTISGAAVSPNMGYHSSPAIAFLLALFNVRLGWWLGNPGRAGANTHAYTCPKFGPKPLFDEAFGLTDHRHKYVYLSDGGHFDNLGLYEMIWRRCHVIIVSDAGRDPACTFEDLGNAMRKVRIDTGVAVDFDLRIPIYPRADKKPGGYCAVATIDYKSVDGEGAQNGVLIYIKPAVYGGEPADVSNYASVAADFPHESTADQSFSESQFESYRALGSYMINKIAGSGKVNGKLEEFLSSARDHLREERK